MVTESPYNFRQSNSGEKPLKFKNQFQRNRTKSLVVLLAIAALVTVGCASGGGSAGDSMDAPKAAAKVDYTKEVGENGLPTPRALLARYVEATGGEEAIRSGEYSTVTGKFMMPAMGMEGELVLKTKAPNMMVMNIDLGGFGAMNTGFNGVHGWSDNPMAGPQLLEGQMLDEMKRQADFYAALNYDKMYPTQETQEQVEWEGVQAYKLHLVDAAGKESTQYFAVDSGLLVGTVGSQTSEMGEMEVTTIMGDYEQFGPVKVPTSTTMKMMGMEMQQTVTDVNFDPIDASEFNPPASIQKLIDAQ